MLAELRALVDHVQYRDRYENGVFHAEIQAGYPPTPYPRWGGADPDIKKAYEKAISNAVGFWIRSRRTI